MTRLNFHAASEASVHLCCSQMLWIKAFCIYSRGARVLYLFGLVRSSGGQDEWAMGVPKMRCAALQESVVPIGTAPIQNLALSFVANEPQRGRSADHLY
jgi:hypothetical protein